MHLLDEPTLKVHYLNIIHTATIDNVRLWLSLHEQLIEGHDFFELLIDLIPYIIAIINGHTVHQNMKNKK